MNTAHHSPISALLTDGEFVLWEGHPNKPQFVKAETKMYIFLFGSCTIVLLLCSLLSVSQKNLLYAALTAIAEFITVIVAREYTKGWKNHDFVVTNKRLIQSYPGEDAILFTIIEYDALRDVKLQKDADGVGTITCRSKSPVVRDHLRFKHIPDVQEVYQLILSMCQGEKP